MGTVTSGALGVSTRCIGKEAVEFELPADKAIIQQLEDKAALWQGDFSPHIPLVDAVEEEGSAFRAGILPGDVIISAWSETKNIRGINLL